MNRPSRTLIWLLLVPYFAVASINAPAWMGETRRETNRANAQLILALICYSPILFAACATGYAQRGVIGDHPTIFALITFAPTVLLVSVWLKGPRETGYRQEYMQLPLTVRFAFGIATGTLMVAGFMAFVVPA
jgi:hypothetical protein